MRIALALMLVSVLVACSTHNVVSVIKPESLGPQPPGKTISVPIAFANRSKSETCRIVGLEKLCGVRVVGLTSSLIPAGESVNAMVEIYVPKIPGEHMAMIDLDLVAGNQKDHFSKTYVFSVLSEPAVSATEVHLVNGVGKLDVTGLLPGANLSVGPANTDGLMVNIDGKSVTFRSDSPVERSWSRKVLVSTPGQRTHEFDIKAIRATYPNDPRIYPRKVYCVPGQEMSAYIVSKLPVTNVHSTNSALTIKLQGKTVQITCRKKTPVPIKILGTVQGTQVTLGEVYCGN